MVCLSLPLSFSAIACLPILHFNAPGHALLYYTVPVTLPPSLSGLPVFTSVCLWHSLYLPLSVSAPSPALLFCTLTVNLSFYNLVCLSFSAIACLCLFFSLSCMSMSLACLPTVHLQPSKALDVPSPRFGPLHDSPLVCLCLHAKSVPVTHAALYLQITLSVSDSCSLASLRQTPGCLCTVHVIQCPCHFLQFLSPSSARRCRLS